MRTHQNTNTHRSSLMAAILQIVLLLSFLSVTRCELTPMNERLPCAVHYDNSNAGALTNCAQRGLQSFNATWIPDNTTTLDLSNNRLHTLTNRSLEHLSRLVKLLLHDNEFHHLEVDCFRGLRSLEALDLRGNKLHLSLQSFPLGVFSRLNRLQALDISENVEPSGSSPYLEFAQHFPSLTHLKGLAIDSSETLNIGPEFEPLTLLKHVEVRGRHLHRLTNSSIVGLKNMILDTFDLHSCLTLKEFGSGIFQPLSHLRSLRVRNCGIGNVGALESLKPFENGNLNSLILESIGKDSYASSASTKDGFLTGDVVSPLRAICVKHLVWINSRIIQFDPSLFSNLFSFAKCVRSINTGGNLFETFHSFKYFKIHLLKLTSLKSLINSMSPFKQANLLNYLRMKGDFDVMAKAFPITEDSILDVVANVKQARHFNHGRPESTGSEVTPWHRDTEWMMWPKSLEVLILYKVRAGVVFPKTPTIYVAYGNVIKHLYFVNSGTLQIHGKVINIQNIILADFSESDVRWNDNNPFESFPKLEVLRMSGFQRQKYAVDVFDRRLLHILHNLVSFEASDNSLDKITDDAFAASGNITRIVLRNNKFANIPFDITTTPKLQELDLTKNAIRFLTSSEMTKLDRQVQGVGTFRLSLGGNRLVCNCEHILFLSWLSTTLVTLDQHGNYTCTTGKGELENTKEMTDKQAMWRHCVGTVALFCSLVLLCLHVIGFLTVYMRGKIQIALRTFLLKTFTPKFRMKTAADYLYDVFVGYADDDFRFIRFTLAPLVEEMMGFQRTYIHQRDLLAGYFDKQLMGASQASWRVLLVISENFVLRCQHAGMLTKMASGCMSVENPGRLVILVEESLRYQLPDFLLDVVDEDRIVVLQSWKEPLTQGQTHALWRCLRK